MKWKESFGSVYYSLPVQLLVTQIRHHKIMLLFWIFLMLTVTGNFGAALGIPYLFLAPEYMGEVGFTSLFLVGCGVGAFISAYAIATYINDSYRFHFLAYERSPFLTFVLNNSLLPITFMILYSVCFLRFHSWMEGGMAWHHIGGLTGFYCGVLLVLLIIMAYFFTTNKSLAKVFGEAVVSELKSKRVILEKARAGLFLRNRVDVFLGTGFRFHKTDPSIPADFRKLVRILNQNHGNALFVELIFIVVVMALGLLEEYPMFQLPAGMSILLMLAIILMLLAAFTFWLRRLGPVGLVALIALYFVLDNTDMLFQRHQALGMSYEGQAAAYNQQSLRENSEAHFFGDLLHGRDILDRWADNRKVFHTQEGKPRIVILCTSGGGLRSAYWTLRCLQEMDSLSGGEFLEQTRLITGASGGMIGAAYARELFLQKKLGRLNSWSGPEYSRRMSRDILNRVGVKIVTGLFLPTSTKQVGSMRYPSDRGYSFDDQLRENLGVFGDTRLSDYRLYEESAVVPQMIFSPVIIDDGRRLYISSTPVSYLTRHMRPDSSLDARVTGVEFSRFFEDQWADSLLFVTALRMNASFPLITPYIQLPSEPPVRVIDAGVADNYGVQTAVHYLQAYQDWFRENADRILLLQIRDSRPAQDPSPQYKRKSLIGQMMDPIGGTYASFSLSKEFQVDDYVNFARSALGEQLDYKVLSYEPSDSSALPASLSWHLTPKEVEGIESSLHDSENEATMHYVSSWLRGEISGDRDSLIIVRQPADSCQSSTAQRASFPSE